jgi:Xaa-Pro aminopeptidase
LPEIHWRESHAIFLPIRVKKSPAELAALRAAGRVLADICDRVAALIETGKREYQVIADIDRLARDKGVEDIRIMAGDDRLRPPNSRNLARLGSHWTLYLAIQYERYWAESGRTYFLAPDAKLYGAYQRAQEIVAQMAGQLRPGNAVAAIDQCARNQLGEFYATALLYGLGNGIGLNPWEAPFLSEDEARQAGAILPNVVPLEENITVALRVVFESDSKLVMHGDTFEVTAAGAVSLTAG